MTDARQTLTSEYGQDAIDLPAEIPTSALRWILARTHVGTPRRDVLRDTRDRIVAHGDGYTRTQRHETMRAALWIHEENLRRYQSIMRG